MVNDYKALIDMITHESMDGYTLPTLASRICELVKKH